MRNRLVAGLGAWLMFAWLAPPLAAAAEPSPRAGGGPSLSMGIVPQQSATRLAQLWTPILVYLGAKTGYTIHFKTARDIPTFEQRLARGEYDLAYMNPYHYTVFSLDPGYRAFAKEMDTRLQGIIVVRKGSRYGSISDLNGLKVAFPAPAAFAATIVPRAHMQKAGIRIVPSYLSSHDSVYAAVAKGIYPAGGGVLRTFRNLDPELSSRLQVLWITRAYTPHALAAHPRVPDAALARLRAAMVAMHRDPEGMRLLRAIGFKGIATARDDEYDDTRELGIKLLADVAENK